jgi:SdrD B-like domain
MTRIAPPARRLARGLCGLGGCAFGLLAGAQPVAPPPAPPAYQDHYIDGGALAPDIATDDSAGGDATEGLARSLQVDGIVAALHSHESDTSNSVVEKGVVVKSQWETVGYGAWSLDGAAHAGGAEPGEAGSHGVVTLRQRDMPFDGGWHADNALGDLNSVDVSLARLQPRFFLPTAPMQGATTEWRGPSGLEVVAGAGQPGVYDGIAVPGFRTLTGSTATAGAEWSPAAHWTVGGQLIEARDVNLAAGSLIDLGERVSSTAGLVSALWQDTGRHVQFNLIDGGVTGAANGAGAWIDGAIQQGRILQNVGIFRIAPDLTWGNQLISNDVEGGYYRVGYQSRQWIADVGIDAVRSVSGLAGNTTFVTADTRYQLSRDWGLGGVANVSHTSHGTGWSVEGYVDHQNALGTGRAQLDLAETPSGSDTTVTLDQAWSGNQGLRLATALSVERISGALLNDVPQSSTVLGLAVNGGGQFTTRLGMDCNVRWTTAVEGRAAPGVSATVSLTWQLSRSWQLLATYYDSEAGSWTPLTVVSPLTPPSLTVIPAVQERGGFLTIRYQRAAGAHFAPLGGLPGAGSGSIGGVVYLDSNLNGRLDAGEPGAANVTVVLDGRFSVRTDPNGRFEFPVVAAGHHVITVVSDNVPLPWFLANDGRVEVDLATRGRANVEIGAQRLR